MQQKEGDIETYLHNLRESIMCPICLEDWNDPVTLTCSHIFCKSCINEVSNQSAGNICRLTVEIISGHCHKDELPILFGPVNNKEHGRVIWHFR
jgi:hypothetical protein